jgi:hypothetical protein
MQLLLALDGLAACQVVICWVLYKSGDVHGVIA